MRALLPAALALAACEGVLPGIDWQQMIDQHKFQAYEACAYFADGRAMQAPPPHTVAHAPASPLDPPEKDGTYLDHVAVPLTRAVFLSGRSSFETLCATCHGADGGGQSEVARHMELRRPPSLIAPPVREYPPGKIFRVITDGYGLMPSYALELTVEERWAVVAYLVALQRSQSTRLDELPSDVRRAALEALRAP